LQGVVGEAGTKVEIDDVRSISEQFLGPGRRRQIFDFFCDREVIGCF
jgi:hypothetical protein